VLSADYDNSQLRYSYKKHSAVSFFMLVKKILKSRHVVET